MKNLSIELIQQSHFVELFKIYSEICLTGTFWPYSDVSEEQFRTIWYRRENIGYVGLIDGIVAGAYFIKSQWPDRGAHVATAQYMISSQFRGLGLGSILGDHSIKTAKERGYSSFQLNLVVSTNEPALKLYEKIGFKIVGRLPSAFHHAQRGLVDAFIMHQIL